MKPLSEYKEGSQNRAILRYCIENEVITSYLAALFLGVTQFHARITELQVDGYSFIRTKVIP
ncbi:MAG: hypothetical protein GY810_21080, partial [Aureispira sp.]|nr:hypothetical protein [Aureispira sp.]